MDGHGIKMLKLLYSGLQIFFAKNIQRLHIKFSIKIKALYKGFQIKKKLDPSDQFLLKNLYMKKCQIFRHFIINCLL